MKTVCIQFIWIIYPHFFVEFPRRSSTFRSKLTDAVISKYSAPLTHPPSLPRSPWEPAKEFKV